MMGLMVKAQILNANGLENRIRPKVYQKVLHKLNRPSAIYDAKSNYVTYTSKSIYLSIYLPVVVDEVDHSKLDHEVKKFGENLEKVNKHRVDFYII